MKWFKALNKGQQILVVTDIGVCLLACFGGIFLPREVGKYVTFLMIIVQTMCFTMVPRVARVILGIYIGYVALGLSFLIDKLVFGLIAIFLITNGFEKVRGILKKIWRYLFNTSK